MIFCNVFKHYANFTWHWFIASSLKFWQTMRWTFALNASYRWYLFVDVMKMFPVGMDETPWRTFLEKAIPCLNKAFWYRHETTRNCVLCNSVLCKTTNRATFLTAHGLWYPRQPSSRQLYRAFIGENAVPVGRVKVDPVWLFITLIE